jgi:hypothetical protein
VCYILPSVYPNTNSAIYRTRRGNTYSSAAYLQGATVLSPPGQAIRDSFPLSGPHSTPFPLEAVLLFGSRPFLCQVLITRKLPLPRGYCTHPTRGARTKEKNILKNRDFSKTVESFSSFLSRCHDALANVHTSRGKHVREAEQEHECVLQVSNKMSA